MLRFQNKIAVLIFVFCIPHYACNQAQKTEVDLMVFAKKIYLSNENFETADAMVITHGKIVATGGRKEMLSNFSAKETKEFNSYVFPGLIDAHSHFFAFGKSINQVDLVGTGSMEQVVQKTMEFAEENSDYWITGRGWDQNDWVEKGFPNNLELSFRFPDRPILLRRIDGHAALANAKALELAGITIDSKIDGGEIEVRNGILTGLLIDNAVDLVREVIDKPSRSAQIDALLKAQEKCLEVGLTCVCDAGVDKEMILLIDSLHESGDLKIRVYAMCNPSEENFEYFKKHGAIQKERLQVSSFKVYADGALGSYGAMLREPYCDRHDHYGFWITSPDKLEQTYQRISDLRFQANTHCIGDSANHLVLELYSNQLGGENDRRWRIEHAQVVSPEDLLRFKNFSIIPSIQPTHATSDMYWADERLCESRIDHAYAYQSLLKNSIYIALGTDFPIEGISPLATLFAAVYRMDSDNFPLGGYHMEEALSPQQALQGMTLWAAKANFMDDRIGSLEQGKCADFIVVNKDLMISKGPNSTSILATYIDGIAMW